MAKKNLLPKKLVAIGKINDPWVGDYMRNGKDCYVSRSCSGGASTLHSAGYCTLHDSCDADRAQEASEAQKVEYARWQKSINRLTPNGQREAEYERKASKVWRMFDWRKQM